MSRIDPTGPRPINAFTSVGLNVYLNGSAIATFNGMDGRVYAESCADHLNKTYRSHEQRVWDILNSDLPALSVAERLMATKNKIAAIKMYRERTSTGLLEAKTVVDYAEPFDPNGVSVYNLVAEANKLLDAGKFGMDPVMHEFLLVVMKRVEIAL